MKISICIPTYKAPEKLLKRCLDSIELQTFRDFEIVQMDDLEGKGMSWNTNRVIKAAKGELIKILYQDDFFYYPHALQDIVDTFDIHDHWLVSACSHYPGGEIHQPVYNHNINTIGSPSVLTMRNQDPLLFNENLKWILDLDLYRRLYAKWGEPRILSKVNVVIGLGNHQETARLSDEIKKQEEAQL